MTEWTAEDKAKYMDGLTRLSTIDGREVLFTGKLSNYLSEGALHRYRTLVEVEHLIALSESDFSKKPEISDSEKISLRNIYHPNVFNERDVYAIAEYDHFGRYFKGKYIEPVEHDVKANEMFINEKLYNLNLERLSPWVHNPLTSEDTNNLAWNLMLRDAMDQEWVPAVLSICDKLENFATIYSHTPVLEKTHGMDASPTSFGKRFSYILDKMTNILITIRDHKLSGKLSGSTGNDNSIEALTDFNYSIFAKDFVEKFGFVFEENSNQRSSHMQIVRLFNEIKNMNIWGEDFCETVRHSVMLGWLFQEAKEGHAGSSVMPHKINSWFFEVGQGTLEKANRLIDGLPEGSMISVFGRDLTDHPWERGYGEMLGKSLVGLKYIDLGLDTLRVNDKLALEQLQTTPEVLSEAVQIGGRIVGIQDIYTKIKLLTRGRKLDRETLDQIIFENIPESEMQEKLLSLKTEEYIGRAPQIALDTAARYQALRPTIENGVMDSVKQIDAVLFDYDNTLQVGDKEELYARLEEITSRMKLGFSLEQIIEFGNRSDYLEMRSLMVEAYNNEHPLEKITEDDFEAVGREVSGMFDDKIRLAEGAKELLENLIKSGKKIGLVTTRGANSLPRLLEKHGINHIFDVIINRSDCIERKPHPQPIALALERLGISDPKRTVYVGDLQTDDVIAGNALGMQTVLVNNEQLDKYGARPTLHISSLKLLLSRFAR